MVDLWLVCRGDAAMMAMLPFPGALLDQPAALIDSFQVCASAYRLLTKRKDD